MTRLGTSLLAVLLISVAWAGCLGTDQPLEEQSQDDPPETPGDTYEVPERDPDIALEEFSELVTVPSHDIQIHVRIVKPADADEVPVIAEFTPYNAPGRAMLIEPQIDRPSHYYVNQFVERGFAFAFADVRGTSDSGGCLDLRGSIDIHDADRLTEWLGTQGWSNGKVGFIGASYPGSEAHIAAIADNEHLGGVIPVVASTSFYGWHHKAGIPYTTHAAGFYYTQDNVPSANPQHENWLDKEVHKATECEQEKRLEKALDGSGTYDDWWRDRDLNHRTGEVSVPVLMAHGLADWNVKPDHIAPYFNELDTNKTLIAEQMGHSFPGDAEDAYGDWWDLAAAFFDETLNGAKTGMFDGDKAYVEDNTGTWHTYHDAWPPIDPVTATVNLTETGLSFTQAPGGTVTWQAPPGGQRALAQGNAQVILESDPLEGPLHVSGVPTLNLTVVTEEELVHLVAVLEVGQGDDWTRENQGYLNPIYRDGLDQPGRVVPGVGTPVTIEMYPQEDIFEKGDKLRLTLRSDDVGWTLPSYDPGTITAVLDGQRPGQLTLPLSPLSN